MQVFRKSYLIAEFLIAMHQQGYMESIGDQFCYQCGKTTVAELNKKATNMELELTKWTNFVKDVRRRYYQLNSFTMKQLLCLRGELYHPKELNFQVVSLLKTLLPCASEFEIAKAIESTWEELFQSPHVGVIPDTRKKRNQEPTESAEMSLQGIQGEDQYLELEAFLESSALKQKERDVYHNMTESQRKDPYLTLLAIMRIDDEENCTVVNIIDVFEEMMLKDENQPTDIVIDEINTLLSKRAICCMLKHPKAASVASDHTSSEATSSLESDEASTDIMSSSSTKLSLSRYCEYNHFTHFLL